MSNKILVWDFPTRIFHWLLALSFVGAFITGDAERYRDIHLLLGYLMLGLIGFRLIWGMIGSRYARFSSFWFKPSAVLSYTSAMLKGKPPILSDTIPRGQSRFSCCWAWACWPV